jgi:hypothetical protein
MQELASKEAAVAKALRNPTTYTSAVVENDTINACLVMWRASEDYAATMQCINDATPTTMAEHRLLRIVMVNVRVLKDHHSP